ncbi:hypothetical protein [Pseudonocardia acidicola]|uniref:Phosphodiester glycosidase domain-containing protein n=1 Tax=Pseudonocardia acidicola TaxID=2724939 RepID=A0ABX1SJB5_9PSEU|nr:hypothetical protein [Pseudonocardia acidicola]NMI01665.1 hypothetical protein [Pseudonocardia acidicola]
MAVVLVTAVGVSYARALTFPGNASWPARTVGWVRDHGGGGLVDLLEYWRYSHNQPTGAAPAAAALPHASAALPAGSAGPRPLPLLAGVPALPGEGMWTAGPRQVGGLPGLYTGYFRPDPRYPSLVVGAAWMDQALLSTRLIAGTREPGGAGWPSGSQVPTALRSILAATFNSGFRLTDAQGGYYAHHRTAVPLRDGAASLVVDNNGVVSIGQWGRDLAMGPTVAAVRQNLALLVDHGRVLPGPGYPATDAWGSIRNQVQYTWRSGLGTDAAGHLIYVAGDQLNLTGLAHAMVAAGITRGMQLDIHPGMVDFTSYGPGPGRSFGLAPTKLLPAMPGSVDRYLTPDQRDFLAVTVRPAPVPATSG